MQVELDLFAYAREDKSVAGGRLRLEELRVLPVNLKLGLNDKTDLQLLIAPYVRQTVTDRSAGVRDRTSAFGDVTLRLKRNLLGNDGGDTALALMPFVTLPTSADGGADSAEFGLIVPLAIAVADRVGIGLMTEIDFREGGTKGHTATFVNSATISFDLNDRLGAYTELFTERGSERGARWIVTGDIGMTYAMSDDLQFDAGVNLGLTDAADDVEIFVGVSRRF